LGVEAALRGVVRTSVKISVEHRPDAGCGCNGMAVSRDGTLVYLANAYDFDSRGICLPAVQAFRIADGARVYVFNFFYCAAHQVAVSPTEDGLVFVADSLNKCVWVLTPTLDMEYSIGSGKLHEPRGVCVNADVVCVSDERRSRVYVFRRSDGALLRAFGREGGMRGSHNLCFMANQRHVALFANKRVHIFDSASGVHVRTVGAGLRRHDGIMLVTPSDEIVIAVEVYSRNWKQYGLTKIVIYDAYGTLLKTFLCNKSIEAFAQIKGTLLGYDKGCWKAPGFMCGTALLTIE
jgi:hypothetical protein